ncbi:MarR family winged helix-turn-helix transcriptional regulator [Mycolicibacterium sphagni]|uniref:MarR family winged helix-turn-helix transcriptional regulator n=1 Tax=Mycolicibacterium sphagni TaxID=1786 RepID=UPI001F1827E6|nr:MarR family transcriptional regulator [Mycolicibacterium sphagni]
MEAIAAWLEQSALLNIRQLADRSEFNVTALDVLHRLDTAGPVRLTALAAAAGVSQPSMSQLIRRLECRGMTQRTTDTSDGRATLVTITDVGRDMVRQRRRDLAERLAALLATLPINDRAGLELAARVALPLITRLTAVEASNAAQRVPR